mmetsp:Transcript_35807/g.83286  ORF Transcript_35807/g.83286 Transcript_35807/m.83286 type:complete len:318 (+) Transcript_35807:114-1067(+)
MSFETEQAGEPLQLANVVDQASSPTRVYPYSALVMLLCACGLAMAVPFCRSLEAKLTAWVLAGSMLCTMLVVLAMWPCARAAHRPVLAELKQSAGVLVSWRYTQAEWRECAEAELGPCGKQRRSLMRVGCCALLCGSPVFALACAGLAWLSEHFEGALKLDFGTWYLAFLAMNGALVAIAVLLQYGRLVNQYAHARKHSGICIVWRNCVLHLGNLTFWNMGRWFGNYQLHHLELDQDAGTDRRMLQFFLVQEDRPTAWIQGVQLCFLVQQLAKGFDHVEAVLVPRGVEYDEISRLALALGVPLSGSPSAPLRDSAPA